MDPKFLQSAEFYRRRYHNFATLLIVPLVCLIIFLVIFLCFAKKEITVISTGEVAPTKVVDVIQSYSDSSIIKNNLDNNAAVEKGDVLIEYSENASPNRQTEQKNIIKERQKREEKEKKKHQKSKKASKDKKKKSKDKESSSDDENETKKVSIFASEDGIIHTNPKYDGANIIPKQTEIAQIYPDIQKTRKVLITYYASSDDVVSMKKGQTARLSLEKKGNDKVVIEGKINNVASSATTTKKGNLFKVTAKVKVSKKNSKLIKYGMTGKTVTVIDKKTYFDYFKDKLLHKMDN